MADAAFRLAQLLGQVPNMQRVTAPSFGAGKQMEYMGFGAASAAGRPGSSAASSFGAGGMQKLEAGERHAQMQMRADQANNSAALQRFQALAGITGDLDRMGLQREKLDAAEDEAKRRTAMGQAKMAQDAHQFDETLDQRERGMQIDADQSEKALQARAADAAAARQMDLLGLKQRGSIADLDRESRARENKLNRDHQERMSKLKAQGNAQTEQLKRQADQLSYAEKAAKAQASSYRENINTGKPELDPEAFEKNVQSQLSALRGEPPPPSHEDIEATAKKYGMTPEEVLSYLQRARGG